MEGPGEAAASDEEDMMRILVATDNHIGFMEKDPIRYNDSLEAFEEILKIAKSQDVDFILLGGDLYHENKPSRQTLHCTMELLRQYCMGSRPCPIELRSDPKVNFDHSKFPVINYEDPNYNVAIPVFSIHGNHDDPVGEGNLSAMDVLHVSNLINYFGKVKDIEKIELSPLLLQKGETKLALYGLGSCRDERLHRMFRRGNVKFLRPSEEESLWFNVLVLHQNRAKHGSTNYIPPSFIPDFFDLVIWGHEHECLLEPQFVLTGPGAEEKDDKGLFISQPGSSIATSLSEGEQKPKHCGILCIKRDCSFKMEPVKLKTVRPFILDSVCLSESGIHPQDDAQVETYLTEKVNELIQKAKEGSENDKLPLVRLKVDHFGGYNTFSLARFGQKFLEKVANPKNILQWYIRREKKDKKKRTGAPEGEVESEERPLTSADISYYLEKELSKESIELLSNRNMEEAIREFVDKNEPDSVTTCVKHSLKVSQNHLKSSKVQEADIDNFMSQQKEEFFKVQEKEGMDGIRKELAQLRAARADSFEQENSDSDSSTAPSTSTQASTRGRGRGRGSRGRRGGTSSSRGASASASSTGGTRRGRGRGRGKGAAAAPESPSPMLNISGLPAPTTRTARGSKRPLSYDDDDEPFPNPKKKTGKAAGISSGFVDLTQGSDDEDMPFSRPTQAKRRKK